MVSPNVKRPKQSWKKCSGYSLIELVVASLISLMVITSLTTVLVVTQKHALNRHQNVLLAKSLDTALNEIKREVRRAGFYGERGENLTLFDSDNIIDVQENILTFSYQLSLPEEPIAFRLISYKADLSDKKLKVCYLTVNSTDQLKRDICKIYYSVFDEKSVKLTNYKFELIYPNKNTDAYLLLLSLTVQPKGSLDITKTRTAEIFPGNQLW
ncbi:prepilin-type N-terminal cleavage/methylation domain-containing protein [Vibrio sp. HN007]|uniref:prepilin-type N-terminal cleavage/methylation domain-containing protein n=1 Tax=Vibrio iocasae TaxID=3098914 RepID=UPI0035D498C1